MEAVFQGYLPPFLAPLLTDFQPAEADLDECEGGALASHHPAPGHLGVYGATLLSHELEEPLGQRDLGSLWSR